MSQYFETIRIEEGKIFNISYHQSRFEKTRAECLGLKSHESLEQLIRVPERFSKGLVRCRISYGQQIEEIAYTPYERKIINSLKVVFSDSITYPYKYSDRSQLSALYDLKGSCDDILIVRQGEFTDSYVANAVFWSGQEWHTPLHPLLPGTMRASLLDQGAIKAEIITTEVLPAYRKIKLINAFHTLDEAPELDLEALKY